MNLLKKIDTTSSTERSTGSGRPRRARTEENIHYVAEEILSQDDDPGSHSTPTLISKRLDVSVSSVRRIVRDDLKLKPFKKIKAQKLTPSDVQKRVDRCKKLLRNITKEKLNRTFFTDEKIFKLQKYSNFKNIIILRTAVSMHPCLLYTSPSPRDKRQSRMPSSA